MKQTFQHLALHKPLVVLDLETTGVNQQEDRIVELAAVRFTPELSAEPFHTGINPGISIPSTASDIHGITDSMVQH